MSIERDKIRENGDWKLDDFLRSRLPIYTKINETYF
jgi:hypothetical protein